MINLNVGDLPSHVLRDLSNLSPDDQYVCVIDLGIGLLIIGHAGANGQLCNLPLIESIIRFAQGKNLNYAIACCYPARARYRYPSLVDAIVGNWGCQTNLQYHNPILSFTPVSELQS